MAKAITPRGNKGAETVHRARALFLRALDIVGERGKAPAEILADQFESNALNFMEKFARTFPRDLNINQTTTVQMVDLLNLFWSAREGRAVGGNLVHSNQPPSVVQRISDEAHDEDSITH